MYEDEEGRLQIKELLLSDHTNDAELKMFKDAFWDQLMKALDELPENREIHFYGMRLRI